MKYYICQIALLAIVLGGCQRSAQSYLTRGDRLSADGKYEEAILNYRNALKRNQQDAEVYYRLALAELKLGQNSQAYASLTQAANMAPRRDDIQKELGDVALDLYNRDPRKTKSFYDQVVKAADTLLSRNASSVDGLRLRGYALTLDGKLDDALAVFKKANSIKPNDTGIVLPLVQVLLRLKQEPAAEGLGIELTRVHKDFGPIYDVLYRYYMQANRTMDAERLLRAKVSAAAKADASATLQLASFYWQTHREPEMHQALAPVLSNPKDFPRGHAIVGDFYALIGKRQEAVAEYESGLAGAPRDEVFYRKKMVQVLIAEGKGEAATEELNLVLKATPNDLDARLGRAILLRGANDPKKLDLSISEMKDILKTSARDERVHYELGMAYLTKGDTKNARTELAASASINQAYIEPRVALAEMEQKARNYREAVRLADQVLAIDPSNQDGRLWHAAGLLGSKAYDQARTEFNTLLRERPDSQEVKLHLAALEVQAKNYRQAETLLLSMYKPGGRDLETLAGLVQIYIIERQGDKAMKVLGEELKLAPASVPLHRLMSTAAERLGRLDIAQQQNEWLRSVNPKSADAYASLGNVYRLKGDVPNALNSYETARQLAPDDPLVLSWLGVLDITSGKPSAALAPLRKNLANNPEDALTLNNLAFALAETGGNLDEALALANKALSEAPDQPGIKDTLGWIYVRKGLNDSAIQIYTSLVQRYPEEPAFRYHMAVAYIQMGKIAQAKEQLTIVLSKKPPKDLAIKVQAMMSRLG